MNDLESNNVSHQSFARGDQRLRKVVMMSAQGLDTKQFAQEIEQIINRAPGLNNIQVKWETSTKRQTITQYHRCQEYVHGQRSSTMVKMRAGTLHE